MVTEKIQEGSKESITKDGVANSPKKQELRTILLNRLKIKAKQVANRENLDESQVLEVLVKTVITDNLYSPMAASRPLKFRPSIERAMRILRPKVALRIFLSMDLPKLLEFMETIEAANLNAMRAMRPGSPRNMRAETQWPQSDLFDEC